MRILAIRGCNLASLAGAFEVDLAAAPLGGAGVFAIVGNTGAGKSTLLDAMCAALFDRTPRLGAPSRVQVGRGPEDPLALGATDVRTLLRRGATAGWAEVDFESGDARRYRARWAVRRARGHSDGALQDQQLSLTALDHDERLGGTKTETLRTIQQRLGLTFDQFRRSALLAQGEFAAFLRADGKDRSELLERMTGTEIYSRLSIAAHLRAARAELELRDRRAAALAIAVLDDDARAARGAELEVARGARVAAREALLRAEAAARWQVEAARREAALADARATGAAARAAIDAAAGERDELALRRRAEALRPVWDAAARLDRELAATRLATESAEAAATATRGELDAVVTKRAAIAERHAPVRAARVAAGLVERAARGGGKPVDAAEDAAWLARHAALARAVAAWPALEAKLAQHAAERAAIAGIDHALAARAADDGRLRAARDAASAEHAEAARRLEAAQRKAVGLRERGAGPSLDAARRAEDAARIRRGEVAALATIAAAARERVAARGVIADELAVVDAAVGADRAAIAVATAARDAARGAVAELDHSVATLRTIAGYGHARTELIDGEPCPLCGAVEHPWRDRGAMDAAIRDAEHRLAAARGRDAAATGELAAIAARDAHHRAERARLVARAAALDAARAGQLAAWRDQLAALAELALVDDPDAPAAAGFAAERMVAADAACEAARAERARVEAGLKAAADAHQESLARQADVGHVVARLASIDDDRRALAAVVERHAGERAARLAHAAELAAQIAAELAPWRDVVADAEPAAAIATLVAAWRRAADRIATADAELAAADAALVRAVAAAERAVAEADARATAARARRDVVIGEHAGAAAALAAATAEAGLDPAALHRLLAAPAGHADALAARLDALARADALAVAVAAERARDVAAHAASCPADLALVAQVGALDRAAADADALVARLVAELAADDDARTRRAAALVALADATAGYEVDRVLGEVIGSHDGKLFRSFAQSLTLDSLLAVANAHLDELAPRYRLERVPRHDLELQVVDRELGGELRSVQSLSGGESFLVSLALALGLSAMSAHDVRVRTLLIDEGFGTLDPATLDTALAVLDRLQATGRQIGVISHVPALVERVGAHVRVIQRGNGRSEVVVAG